MQEVITPYEELRTTLRGVKVLLSPELLDWPIRFQGRLIYRLTLPHQNIAEDGSEGRFTFAGYPIVWRFTECDGSPAIFLSTAYEEAIS